jgi:hypothetical protein
MNAINVTCFGLLFLAMCSGAQAQNNSKSSGASSITGDSSCIVADLKAIALETHDVHERVLRAKGWLQKFGPNCSPFQIGLISANRNTWLGHADSPSFVAIIDRINELRHINMTNAPSPNKPSGTDDASSSQVSAVAKARPPAVAQNTQPPTMAQPLLVQPLAQPNLAPGAGAQAQLAPKPMQQAAPVNAPK